MLVNRGWNKLEQVDLTFLGKESNLQTIDASYNSNDIQLRTSAEFYDKYMQVLESTQPQSLYFKMWELSFAGPQLITGFLSYLEASL